MANITYDPEEINPDTDPELPEPPGAEPVFTDLAEPVDPDADPELLAGGGEEEVFSLVREPDQVDDPELLAGDDDETLEQLSGPEFVDPNEDPYEYARQLAEEDGDNAPRVFGPEDLGVEEEGFFGGLASSTSQFINRATLGDGDAINAASQAATILKAKEQATLAARYKSPANADWRVRLILPEQSDFLYKASPPGILKPLAQSNGVVFPYTPQIQTSYSANYEQYDLVHSNYRGYFYKNSKVGDININAVFTAQDTQEAEYLLAVIHFFRSVTKMFYGKDAQRGAPPPIVYLVGLGDFQFNGHPCLVSNFTYNLPSDVDYIRANNPNNYGTNMLNRVSASTSTSNIVPASVNRLANAIDNFGKSLQIGALSSVPVPGTVPGSVNNLNRSTYVPTKMEINITLLPVQTRAQVSKQFSLKGFANGDLLKGGFW